MVGGFIGVGGVGGPRLADGRSESRPKLALSKEPRDRGPPAAATIRTPKCRTGTGGAAFRAHAPHPAPGTHGFLDEHRVVFRRGSGPRPGLRLVR